MNNQAGGSAYPHENHLSHRGMSLRDYFAAKAMHHWLSLPITDEQRKKVGVEAYKVADAMLEARNG